MFTHKNPHIFFFCLDEVLVRSRCEPPPTTHFMGRAWTQALASMR